MDTQKQSMLSRRRFLQVTGLATGAAMLAACPAPAAAPAADGGGDGEPMMEMKKLQAWSRMTDLAQESIKEIIDIYNEKNTMGVEVEFVYIAQTQGSQADEKLLTAVAGGTPPALHYADRFTVPQFAHEGFFTDITDFAEAAVSPRSSTSTSLGMRRSTRAASTRSRSTPTRAPSGTTWISCPRPASIPSRPRPTWLS